MYRGRHRKTNGRMPVRGVWRGRKIERSVL
jgi:hypothetical protein